MNINSNNFILKPKNDYVFKKIFGDERTINYRTFPTCPQTFLKLFSGTESFL